MLRIVLSALGFFGLLAWAMFYFAIQGLACAFSGPEGSKNCRTKAPWELGREDFLFLVTIPGALIVLVFFLAWLAGRKRTNQSKDN